MSLGKNFKHVYLLLYMLLSTSILPVGAWEIIEKELPASTIQNGIVSHYNCMAESHDINLIETHISANSGQRPAITAEIANLNCLERKSYRAYSWDNSGKKTTHRIKHPIWGIVWGYSNPQNYHALLLRTGESDPQEFNPPMLQYCIFTIAEGDTLIHIPWKNVSEDYLNPETDYNRIHIQPVNGGFELSIGKEQECLLGICKDDRLFGSQAGIYIGSASHVNLRHWSVSAQKYIEHTSYWTTQQIYSYLKKNINEIEGIYEIFGAIAPSSDVRSGGEYRLALIRTDTKYILLYLSGAQRAQEQWEAGMIKAILHPILTDKLFDVTWYDAYHNPITTGVKASIYNGFLKIYFRDQSSTSISFNRIFNTPKENSKNPGGSFL